MLLGQFFTRNYLMMVSQALHMSALQKTHVLRVRKHMLYVQKPVFSTWRTHVGHVRPPPINFWWKTTPRNSSPKVKVHFKKRYPCELCDYQATQEGNLSSHVKNVHQKTANLICNECNKSIQKKYLSTHMKLLHSGEQPQYKCKICTFETLHSNSLKIHVKNIHQRAYKQT